MWNENVDCQPMVYQHVVLKYIAKYASKVEKRSESYQDMLTRITSFAASEDPTLSAYKIFLSQTLVYCDIGAQQIFHMFLKLHIVLCSRKFVSLNLGRKVFKKLSKDPHEISSINNFVENYHQRPFLLNICV
jgi:hypothetical protein